MDREPYMPIISLSPASDKRECCGMLKIQAHRPDCDGTIRSRGRRANRDARPVMTDSDAYARLTRVLTNMHHTERSVLDTHNRYREILDTVQAGDDSHACALAIQNLRTEEGDAYRARNGMPFVR